jgi:hypothetical protein
LFEDGGKPREAYVELAAAETSRCILTSSQQSGEYGTKRPPEDPVTISVAVTTA